MAGIGDRVSIQVSPTEIVSVNAKVVVTVAELANAQIRLTRAGAVRLANALRSMLEDLPLDPPPVGFPSGLPWRGYDE